MTVRKPERKPTIGKAVRRPERRPYIFLYHDGADAHFLQVGTYEQVKLSNALIRKPELLKEGLEVHLLFDGDREVPVSLELPPFVALQITHIKSVKSGAKPRPTQTATLESGAVTQVPLSVAEGDIVHIDPATGVYIGRANQT